MTLPTHTLTIRATARHLQCSERTIRRYLKAGILRASRGPTNQGVPRKFGRWIITAEAIQEFLDKHEVD